MTRKSDPDVTEDSTPPESARLSHGLMWSSIGCAYFVGAWWFYDYYTKIEERGRIFFANRAILFLYPRIEKAGLVIIIVLIGLIFIGLGIAALRQYRKEQAAQPAKQPHFDLLEDQSGGD
ncbi:MAG: hypothetical protein KF726_27125 [Anaerolineae bacterium]|nr:hypothetical protein [Anaerolineae bacterium]